MDPEAIHIASPQQPPVEKLSPFSKLPKPKKPSPLAVILILIAAIALTTTFYFVNQINKLKEETTATPQSQPTESSNQAINEDRAGWKTLNNIVYSYSLKYPDTFMAFGANMDVDETTSNEVIISSDPSKTDTPQIHIIATEKKYTVHKDMSLQDIAQADFDANKSNPWTNNRMIGEIEMINFADEPAYTFQMDSNAFSGEWNGFVGYVGLNKVLEFEHNEIHFTVVYTSNPIFDQILSTFTFLD